MAATVRTVALTAGRDRLGALTTAEPFAWREEPMPTIGELVRQARQDKDMTREALADNVGIERSRISAIEQDEETPTPDQVGEIERALGLARGKILEQAGIVEGP
ncbi:MAG TPA: helix-turn-helix transcriptional regulator [Nitriliruptorales bacterium]|nr:helix-turn-helix transcriptional regulator [Nitriliruptorales bacterium]